MPLSKLLTVREAIRRAEMASGAILCQLVEQAKRIRTENEVLTQSRKDVDELITTSKARSSRG